MKRPVRISRRHLGKLTALGAASAASTVARPVLGRQTPSAWRDGDTLRIAGPPTGVASLDPALSRDLATNQILRQVWRGLVSLDENLEPRMELAESIHLSEDGLGLDVTIRPEARFQDGRQITADDVRGSFTRALDPATAGGNVAGLAGIPYLRDIVGSDEVLAGSATSLSGIEVTGDRMLTITLQERSPAVLLKLASVPASIVDVAATARGPGWLSSPNASGPYAVTSWNPSSSIALSAAPAWWSGEPRTKTVRYLLGTSASQPVNLYQAGEVDLVTDVQPNLVDMIRDPASGIAFGTLLESTIFAVSFIALGNGSPPLDDPHVRRALQRVFPSHLVAESTYRGEAIPADGLIPPGMLGQDWPVSRVPVDIDAAREELARSTYGAAGAVPPIQVYGADVTELEALRDVAARELDLEIEVIQVGWPDFVDGLVQHRFPAYAIYWGADYPDPESLVDMLFASNSADNYTGYSSAELDAMLVEARAGTDAHRITAYAAANQFLVDDAALIPLCHWRGYTLAREGIGGITATAMGLLGLESIHAI